MTTIATTVHCWLSFVVEAYRLDRYDNLVVLGTLTFILLQKLIVWIGMTTRRFKQYSVVPVVEAYRLDRYDNFDLFDVILEV